MALQPVMVRFGRRPKGQGDRPARPFLAPQARRQEQGVRISIFDARQVHPVTGPPAGSNQQRRPFERANGGQPVSNFSVFRHLAARDRSVSRRVAASAKGRQLRSSAKRRQ